MSSSQFFGVNVISMFAVRKRVTNGYFITRGWIILHQEQLVVTFWSLVIRTFVTSHCLILARQLATKKLYVWCFLIILLISQVRQTELFVRIYLRLFFELLVLIQSVYFSN
jgi:hypothetical protein